MRTRRTTRHLLLAMVAMIPLLTLVHVTPAAAAGPTREVLPPGEDWITDACGFPVLVHTEGKTIRLTFYDKSGHELRILETYPGLKVTWTNLNTLKSVSAALPGPGFFDEKTAVGTGPWGAYEHPITGEPGIFVTYGRWKFSFADESFSLVGHIKEFCSKLAS